MYYHEFLDCNNSCNKNRYCVMTEKKELKLIDLTAFQRLAIAIAVLLGLIFLGNNCFKLCCYKREKKCKILYKL